MRRGRKRKKITRLRPCPNCKNKNPEIKEPEGTESLWTILCAACGKKETGEDSRDLCNSWNKLKRKKGKPKFLSQHDVKEENKQRLFLLRVKKGDPVFDEITTIMKALENRIKDKIYCCDTEIIIRNYDPLAPKNGGMK